MKIIVHHLSRDRAVGCGLGSNTEHRYPLADVSFVGYAGGTGDRGLKAVGELWAEKCYEPVAMLTDGDMDDAFRLTNSVDAYWGDVRDRNLTLVTPNARHRSTSVGDVLELLAGDGTSTFHVVAACGFMLLAQK